MKQIFNKLVSLLNLKDSSFSSYLGLTIVLFITIRYLESDSMLSHINSEILIIHYIRSFADAALLALPISFFKKKWLVTIYISLIDLYFLSIVWYFRNYGTIMPIESYTMVQNLNGIEGSIIQSMKLKDIFLILPSILYCIFLFYQKRIKLYSIKNNWKYTLIGILFITIIISPYIIFQKNSYRFPNYTFRIEMIRGFKQFGIIHYWAYQLHTLKGCSNEEKKEGKYYMACHQHKRHNIISRNEKKNLIIIIVESLCNWPLNLKIEGYEITPNLNQLINNRNNIYFPHVLPQVKDGRSSDAQLMINTGLLPINTGATSSLYSQDTYPSIAKELKKAGYYSASLVCDNKSYWNQSATCSAYGFQDLFDNLSDNQTHSSMDEHLFNNAINIISKFKQPFYAQIVTLSSHSPYNKGTFSNPTLEKASFRTTTSKYYTMAINYVDKCIGSFINALKKKDIYNKSIIIITGDHDDETYNHFLGRTECYLSDRFVPLIILNSPIKTCTKNIIGQIDIYPSILDLMGIYNNVFDGLGMSVFRGQDNNAVYHTKEFIGNKKRITEKQNLWDISDILIRMNYFKNQ